LAAIGINGNNSATDDSSAVTYSELRHRFLPVTGESEMSSITVQNPTNYGEIYDAITVNEITTTSQISGGDDSTLALKTSQN